MSKLANSNDGNPIFNLDACILPWIEKYRPTSFDDIILNEHIVLALNKFIENKTLPHLLFHGPSGTGKTSTIMACANKLYGDHIESMVLELNASDERGIEVVRTRIKQFVTTSNMYGNNMFKLVILDETDAMTNDAQAILRKVIEENVFNARFCLLCNYIKKITPALQSRCVCFKFKPLSNSQILQKIKFICESENVNITDDGYDTVIDMSEGDMRKAINTIQSTNMAHDQVNTHTINQMFGLPNNDTINDIIESLFTKDMKTSYDKIIYHNKNDNIALVDLLTKIHKIILKSIINNENIYNMPQKKIITILEHIGNIEYALSMCTFDTLQIAGFVSLFYI